MILLFFYVFISSASAGPLEQIPPTSTNASSHLSPADSMKAIDNNKNYVDISTFSGVKINLRYATLNNFMGINMYGPIYGPKQKVFLHKDAARMFAKAVENLKKQKPEWSFLILDALRPRSVQWIMWGKVKDTPQKKYVANPAIGSPHNYGMALDLTLVDKKGKEIDMGTGFDSFTKLAEPKLEKKFLKKGKLTQKQIANRLVLRKAMTGAGFLQLSHEWWHYNALPEPEIRKKYQIVE